MREVDIVVGTEGGEVDHVATHELLDQIGAQAIVGVAGI